MYNDVVFTFNILNFLFATPTQAETFHLIHQYFSVKWISTQKTIKYPISEDLSIIGMTLINCLEKAIAIENWMQFLGTSYAWIALLHFPVIQKKIISCWAWGWACKQLKTSELRCRYNVSSSHSGQVLGLPQLKIFQKHFRNISKIFQNI